MNIRLRSLLIFILFVLLFSGCAGGIAQVNYPPELTTNNIRVQDKVGLYISPDVRGSIDKRWGISYNMGPQLVVEAEKHFYESFAECRIVHNFPPLSRESEGLDALIVIGKPESTVQRVRTFGYLAHLTMPIFVYTPDGRTLLNTYRSESKVDFEMGALNPMINIEISQQAMQAVVSGATINFLRQYSGAEAPILTAGTMTGTVQTTSGFKGAGLTGAAQGGSDTGAASRTRETARTFRPASGLYAIEQGVTYNVLDNVVFDDETGQVTLIGHYDPQYEGQRIPYLQHLATLLESPKPEFSLEWTKDSEARIDTLFGRMDSMDEMRKVVGGFSEWIGPDSKPTAQGRSMLPLFGVNPTENGKGPGYLGIKTKLIKPQSYGQRLPITQIEPNSPAQKSGLKIGDEIVFIGNLQPYHPTEVVKFTRRAGAGASTKIRIKRPGVGEKYIPVTLGTGSGDPWNDLSRFDMLVQIFKAAEMNDISWTLFEFDRLQTLIETPVGITVLWDIIVSTGNYNKVQQMRNQLRAGRLSQHEFNKALYRLIFEGTDRKLKTTHLASTYDRALRQGRHPDDAFDVAYTSLNQEIKPLMREAMQKLLRRHDEIVMPVSMVKSTLGMTPMVMPTYYGVDRNSQLARVMLEADYLCKFAIDMPELKNRVPGYQTQYAYYRKNGGKRHASGNGSMNQYRMWISIDRIDLAQSPEGHTLEIRDAKMRFNVRNIGNGQSSSHNGGYEKLLTSLYDDLAREFHVLHELREAAKLSAASQWILSKRPDFRLPSEGRLRWQGPDRLPGLVNLIWSPKYVKVEMAAMGGVSFVPEIGPLEVKGPVLGYPVVTDSSVVELKNSNLTALSLKTENKALQRVLRKKTVVPVPRPPGWVTKATKGERTLQALTVKKPDMSQCDAGQSIELTQKLEKAKQKAMMLKAVEDSMNYINGYSPERQKEFSAINSEVTRAQDEFVNTTIHILTQGVSDTYDILEKETYVRDLESMKQGINLMRDAQSSIGDIKEKINQISLAYRVATADDIESRNQAVKELVELTKELMSNVNFRGNDALSRAFRTASKTFDTFNKYKDVYSLGTNLIDLGEGMIRLNSGNKLTDQDLRILSKKLLPKFKDLSNDLDDAINAPVVQDWLSNKSKMDCS